jgi:predicted NAD-dependent protein-ADP-ribosyltransferase YbiA (DUF1768 family)
MDTTSTGPIKFGHNGDTKYVFLSPSHPPTLTTSLGKNKDKNTLHIVINKKTFCNSEHYYWYQRAASFDKAFADQYLVDATKSAEELKKLTTKQAYVTLQHKECSMRTKEALKTKYDQGLSSFDPVAAMKEALHLKFKNPHLKEMLLATYPRVLIYKGAQKQPWNLGDILMQVREELMPKPKKTVTHKHKKLKETKQ